MDVVILTERRYAGTPTDTGPVKGYVDNLLLEDQLVADALRGRGLLVDRRAWCDKEVDWRSTRSALFRTTWDYFDRWGEFAPWLDAAAQRTRFFNSPKLVRWNLDKHYLHDLELAGVQVVPTAYISKGEHVPLFDVAARRGWSEVVIKPAIAGGAVDTYFVNLSGDVHVLSPEPPRKEDSETLWRSLVDQQDMLVQPFLPNRVVHIHRMNEAPVVPQKQIADLPLVMILIFRRCNLRIDLVQQCIAFVAPPTNDTISSISVEIE